MCLWKPVWESVPFFPLERNRRYSHWLHLFLEHREEWREIHRKWRRHMDWYASILEKNIHLNMSELRRAIDSWPCHQNSIIWSCFFNSRKGKNSRMGLFWTKNLTKNKCLVYLTQSHCVLEQCFSSNDVMWITWWPYSNVILTQNVWVRPKILHF